MNADEPPSRGFSLKRWSQRKLEATRAAAAPAPDVAARAPDAANVLASTPPSDVAGQAAAPVAEAASLPPVESLTIDSDFSAYLDPKVDKALKLQALKRLFRDPHFNVMDGLDVYVDDYSIADPIAPDLVRQMAHARYIFDPPHTRVTEAGIVEDVAAEKAPPVDSNAAPSPEALPEQTVPLASAPTTPSDAGAGAGSEAASDSAAGAATPREGSEPARR